MDNHLVVTVTLNPCIDTVLFVNDLKVGDVNRVRRVERDAGGKGINLARIVQKLGGNTVASGFIGGGTGAHVKSVLDAEKVPHDFVEIGGETRSNIFVESGMAAPTCLNEPGPSIGQGELEALIEETRILSQHSAWLAIGGSIPPGVPRDIFCVLTEIGHAAGARVLLDADDDALRHGLKAGPDLIKPNLREAERLLGLNLNGIDFAQDAAGQLRHQLLHDHQRPGYEPTVIVSMGSKGAVMASHEGRFIGLGPQINPISTIGSGDSMLGAFIWALEQGETTAHALRWGVAAGAATAMTSGAEIGSRPAVVEMFGSSRVDIYRPSRGERCVVP